jgi:hypothetical protein
MLTQTDRQIVEQKWVETGRSLPAVSPRYLPAQRRRVPELIPTEQVDQITRIINRCMVEYAGHDYGPGQSAGQGGAGGGLRAGPDTALLTPSCRCPSCI